MSTSNLDHFNLDSAVFGGLINEDVMQEIFDISPIPLPFTEMLQKMSSDNDYKEWTVFDLGTPATDNKTVDGADITQDDSEFGTREGNHHQTSVKAVQVSKRANAADSIGGVGSLAWQVSTQQQKLRRDVEAQMLTNQASIKGTDTVEGQSAGLGAWIKTNVFNKQTGYVAGGFNTTTGIVDAPTQGTTPAALSETVLRDALQGVYEDGGLSKYAMGRPQVIRNISAYMFSSDAAIAAPQVDNNQTNPAGMTMQGSTNIFISDFDSVIKFVSNRLQPEVDTGVDNLYLLDPEYLGQSFLTGYQVEPLAKTGLSDKRLMSVDYTLCVMNEKAQGVVTDIDATTPMVA